MSNHTIPGEIHEFGGRGDQGEVISQGGVVPHWLLTLLLAEWTVVTDEWTEGVGMLSCSATESVP